MTVNPTRALLWRAAALLVAALSSTSAVAQTFFYTEVTRDGRIYVFAASATYDAFVKGGSAAMGSAIERPGYGPNGETVVFDSKDAINLYNYKHGRPGEIFRNPTNPPSRSSPPARSAG